jgi:hypothetical protein
MCVRRSACAKWRLEENLLSKSARFSLLLAGTLISGLSLSGGPITSGLASNATIVNFANLTGGNCNLCGPSVISQFSSLGVTFNNPSYPGQDTTDTNLTASFPNASGPNLLFVKQGGMLSDPPANPFQILFSAPVTSVGFDFGSATDSYLELDAYTSGHQLLETQYFTGTSAPIGLAGFAGLQESTAIVELDVSYHPWSDPSRSLNFSIDNVEFAAIPVPEPSSVALIVAGVFGIAIARRGKFAQSSRS